MRQEELIENIKRLLIATGILFVFLIGVPYILMGDSVSNFNSEKKEVKEIVNDKLNENLIIKINGDDKAKVYRTSKKKVEKISVEDYVLGVVWSEMPASFEKEAIKAQAVAARTFYYSKRLNNCKEANGGEICDSVHCQVYMDKKERLSKWKGEEKDENYKKVKEAVEETKGLVLAYDGELVKYPQYFSTSWGKTENAEEVFSSKVPYLLSVMSKGEEVSPRYKEEVKFTNDEFIRISKNKLGVWGLNKNNLSKNIQIVKRGESGGVKEVKIKNKKIDGVDFRKAFNLNSTNFQIEFSKNNIKILTKGYGHGVGMSQWGANLMAKEGNSFIEILTHYYSGVEIGKISYR